MRRSPCAGSARLRIKAGKGRDWSNSRTVTVTNRSESFTASTDDYIQVIELNGEFRPIGSAGTIGGVDCEDCDPWKTKSIPENKLI